MFLSYILGIFTKLLINLNLIFIYLMKVAHIKMQLSKLQKEFQKKIKYTDITIECLSPFKAR